VSARAAWALLAALALPSVARAQQAGVACDTCESCTAALASAGAFVELGGDVDGSRAAVCVRVAGRGATLDGHRHTVRGAAVGVEVAADDVVVRNVQTQEGGVGFRVTGARTVTLLNAVANDARVGVRVESSQHVRVVRAALSRNRVGISMGADDAGSCPAPAALASPGVVVARSRIEGGSVGVAACDAMPVLTGNTVTGNQRGVVLGEVRAAGTGARGGPWDECSCAAPPAGVAPGTLVLYSSGCGGCTVHESWLPEVRGRGAVVRARPGGSDGGVEQPRFDAYVRHCAPEVVDALGIPGCVPNYACPASAEVWKRREGARELVTDRGVGSPDEVVAFSEACRAAGRQGYARGARCVAAALRGNTLCGNRASDLDVAGAFARWGSAGDRCGAVSGAGARCEQGCAGAADAAGPFVGASASSVTAAEPGATAAALPVALPVAPAAAADAGPADSRPPPPLAPAVPGGWVVGGVLAALAAAAAWRVSEARRK
jgi:hypothetical protein